MHLLPVLRPGTPRVDRGFIAEDGWDLGNRSLFTIPPEKIAEIRDRADIERIVGKSVRLEKKGRRLVGLCPFHNEKTPSFGVDAQKKLFHCFGCQAGGDVFHFVMRIEGVGFHEAALIVAREAGVVLELREENPQERQARERKERMFAVNAAAAMFFQRALQNEPRALAYLRDERGLSDATIARFQLGWAPNEWTALAEHLEKKKFDPKLGVALGLLGLRQGDGRPYDRLRGRVVFPIVVPGGEIAGFGARRSDWIEKDAPKYLNSPESPIYDKSSILYGLHDARDEIRRSRRGVLVEGYLDVIGLHQVGTHTAVAACGTALSPRHASMLKKLTSEIVTMYDGDAAGSEATRKSAEILLSTGLSVRVAQLPEGLDPDDFARKEGPEAVGRLLDGAPSAIDFFVGRAKNTYKVGGIAGMGKAVDTVKPLLLAIADPLERDVCISAAARELGMEPQLLRRHLAGNAPRPQPQAPPRPQERKAPAGPPPPPIELELLKKFIESPDEVLSALEAEEAIRAFTSPVIQATLDAGIEALRVGKPFDAPRALEVATEAGADARLVTILRKSLMEALPEQHDLTLCVKGLLRTKIDIRLRELTRRIQTDPDAAQALVLESAELTRKLAELK